MASIPAPAPFSPVRPALVVVAEDDDELRSLISRALRRDGHDVVAASDGASLWTALASLRDHGREPDLVVSDVRMPQRSGLDVAAELAERRAATRVVLVSAFADPELEARALGVGVAHVLSKPFDLDDLRTVVLHVLGRPRGGA